MLRGAVEDPRGPSHSSHEQPGGEGGKFRKKEEHKKRTGDPAVHFSSGVVHVALGLSPLRRSDVASGNNQLDNAAGGGGKTQRKREARVHCLRESRWK